MLRMSDIGLMELRRRLYDMCWADSNVASDVRKEENCTGCITALGEGTKEITCQTQFRSYDMKAGSSNEGWT